MQFINYFVKATKLIKKCWLKKSLKDILMHKLMKLLLAVAKCGDAPNAGEGVLKVKYEDMQVVYTCPEDHRLYGAEKRTCNEEKMWEPSGDIASKCLPN